MKRIILFESATDSLCCFARQMEQAFQDLGYEVIMLNMHHTEETCKQVYDFAIPGETVAVFFNHVGLNLLTKERDIIWNILDIDCYDYIVDHPMYYHAALIYPVNKITFLCVDQYHKEFIDRFYPGRVKSAFFPLAGIQADIEKIPVKERSMDVLFTGAYLIDHDIGYHTESLGSALKQVWVECFERMKREVDLTLEQAVEEIMIAKGAQLERDDLRDMVRLFKDMDGMLRSFARATVIKTLADNDVKVHIYGEGWEYLACKQENLIIHPRIAFEETIPLIADAKIALNIMPWFKSGAHDRIYTAMLNGTVCMTDTSEYLLDTLEDGKNVLFYSLKELQKLPDKIRNWLENEEELEQVADAGYTYAKDQHTWKSRVEALIRMMEAE